MNLAYQYETTSILRTTPLTERLMVAQQRIEKSFLDAGNVLISVMNAVGGLTTTLDGLTALFDAQSSRHVADGMAQAVAGLSGLPAAAGGKQQAFVEIASLCDTVYSNVDEMREIIRYLRTIAVTVKITGASISEFSGFADEIRERIQSVSDEVDRFADKLEIMRSRLGDATRSSRSVIHDFDAAIPLLVESMNSGVLALSDQQKRMTDTAGSLKRIMGSIQSKVGTVLSALQIGDITRQRIEHVVSLLNQFEELQTSQDFQSIDPAQQVSLSDAIAALAKSQLDEAVADFHSQCGSVEGTIASFMADAGSVMSLRDELAGRGKVGEGDILSQLQRDLARAAELSLQVSNRTRDLDAAVDSVEGSIVALTMGISAIRRIKLDIFYMALNSNLACTKLGENGRAVNVVSGELRIFADRLEGPAEAIVLKMNEIEAAKAMLTGEGKTSGADCGIPLNQARAAVDDAEVRMSTGLAALSAQGASVFSSIDGAIRTLDFKSDLGDVLDECVEMAAVPAAIAQASPIAEGDPVIDVFSTRIFSIYTMDQERIVHRRFLPVRLTGVVDAAASDVEDLIGELF